MNQEDWSPEQWAEYYDKLSQKNYMAYQDSGEPRYDRACYKYEQIAEAFRARAELKKEQTIDMNKRIANKDYAVSRLIPGKMYSREEVAKLLYDAVWW